MSGNVNTLPSVTTEEQPLQYPGDRTPEPPPPEAGTPEPYRYKRYNRHTAFRLGYTQIAIGVTCMILNICVFLMGAATIFAGMWCGIMFVIAGAIQHSAGKTRTKCWIVDSMIMSILAAIFTIPIIFMCTIDLIIFGSYYRYADSRTDILMWMMLLLAVIEMCVAITSSALSCKPLCDETPQSVAVTHIVQYVPDPNNPGQQLAVLTPISSTYASLPQLQAGAILSPPPNVHTQAGFSEAGSSAGLAGPPTPPPAYESVQSVEPIKVKHFVNQV